MKNFWLNRRRNKELQRISDILDSVTKLNQQIFGGIFPWKHGKTLFGSPKVKNKN